MVSVSRVFRSAQATTATVALAASTSRLSLPPFVERPKSQAMSEVALEECPSSLEVERFVPDGQQGAARERALFQV